MNKVLTWLVCSSLSVGLWALGAEKVGESQRYQLNKNSSRTSWVVKDASGTATLLDYRIDPKIGPAYNLKIEYCVDIRAYGKECGVIVLLFPEYMLHDEFASQLQKYRPLVLETYTMDYVDMGKAIDANGATYEQSLIAKLYKISDKVFIGNKQSAFSALLSDLVITLKLKPSRIALGVVELDLQGKFAKIPLKMGLDVIP